MKPARVFRCVDCGELDSVLINGYTIGDRLLEDVFFVGTVEKNKVAVVIQPECATYFATLNQKKWLAEVRRYANRPMADDFICPKCEEGGGTASLMLPRSYYLEAAKKAIEKNDDVVYDVASGKGQIVGNVKHMPWFREAVADELETR